MVGWHHQLNGLWVWVASGSWWWSGKPGMLQSMWLQRVGHDWVTELNWTDVWMRELNYKERWAAKNWHFWTVVLEKTWTVDLENTLESPLDFKEIKQVNPRGNQSWYSLEGLMLKLKLQNSWPPDAKNWLIEKSLVLGKIEGRRRRGRQRMRRFNGISNSMDMNLSKLWEFVMDRKAWLAAFHGVAKIRTQLNNWTDWLRFTGVGFGNWSV